MDLGVQNYDIYFFLSSVWHFSALWIRHLQCVLESCSVSLLVKLAESVINVTVVHFAAAIAC